MNALLGRLWHSNTHIFDYQTFVSSFKSKSRTSAHFFTTSILWYLKQCDLIKEDYLAIVPHLFLLQIYTEWWIFIGFSYRPRRIQTTTEKIELTEYLILLRLNFATSKMNLLRKRAEKVKNHNNFTWLPSTILLLKWKLVSSYKGV